MSAAKKIESQKIHFTIRAGPHSGEHFTLAKELITIGRGIENDIALTKDLKASRQHAQLHLRNDQFIIENKSEKNSILIDGIAVTSSFLKSGQTITVGESQIQVQWELAKTLDFNNVNILAHPKLKHLQQTPQTQHHPQTFQTVQIPQHQSSQIFQNAQNSQNSHQPHRGSASVSRMSVGKRNPMNLNTVIVAVLLIGTLFFAFKEKSSNKPSKGLTLRTDDQIKKDLEEQRQSLETYKKSKNITADGEIENSLASAQSYYVKGFRDYRLGQFGRAIQSFQAALSFNPSHVLAKKYLTLAIRKQDELIDFNMLQGRRYKDKGNYRLCKSAYQQVMIIRKDPSDKKYKEAKQMFDACDTLAKGRY